MVKLAGQMTGETDRLTAQSIAQKRQLTELQSLILKAETKREEAARFLRARADPEFAKMVKVRQLGPEHVENQQRLRKTSGMVRERIQELDEYLVLLKNRVTDEKLGRAPMKAPSLDSIQRAVRNISTSVTERIYEMDELAMQMEMARLSAPTPRAESRARDTRSMSRSRAFDSILDLSEALPKHGAISHAAASRSAATAVAADQASKDIKAVFLAARAEPILNRSAIRQTDGAGKNAGSRKDWDSSDLQMAFARGPVTLGQRVAPSPAPAAAQAAPAVAPAAPNFGPGASPSANSRVDAPAGPSSKPAFCFATPPALPQDIFSLPPETLPFAPGSRDSASLSASSGIHAHAKPNRRAGAPRAVPLPTRASASPTAPPSTFFSSGQGVGGGAFGSGSSTTSTSSGSGAPAPANFFGPPPPFTPPVTRPRGPDFTTFQGLEQPKPLISTSTERASPRTPQRLEEVVSPAAVDEDELEDDEEYPYDEEDEEDDEDGEDGDEYEGEEGGEEGDWDEEGLSDVQEDEEEEG